MRITKKSKGEWDYTEYHKKVLFANGIREYFWCNFVIPRLRKIKSNKCEKCGATKNLDIHKTRLDLINIHTMKLLCRSCHKFVHSGKLKI